MVCGRQAREPHQWASLTWPCCDDDCRAALANVIKNQLDRFLKWEIGELAALTHMEKEAIRCARQSLYNSLVEIGIADAFDGCTAEQVDGLIEKVWNGLRASMHLQSARGEIPI